MIMPPRAFNPAHRYRQAGNEASARFCENKAEQLREQMD